MPAPGDLRIFCRGTPVNVRTMVAGYPRAASIPLEGCWCGASGRHFRTNHGATPWSAAQSKNQLPGVGDLLRREFRLATEFNAAFLRALYSGASRRLRGEALHNIAIIGGAEPDRAGEEHNKREYTFFMSAGAWFGFFGDFLTFFGGIVLAVDAVREEKKFRKLRAWAETIAAPELKGVILTFQGVKLKTGDDIELAFIRKSAKLALAGALILTIGFMCLFVSRCIETSSTEHGTSRAEEVR